MAETLETYRGAVYPWHCDHIGHMNVMWYVGKFDEATWNFFAAIGMPASYLRDKGGMAAVQQNISYKRELHAGDTVFVRTTIAEVREKVLRYTHEMVSGESGETAALCELTVVHLDRATRRASPLPARVADKARALLGG
jgi:acyl-CoA thioester hydrolase